MVPFKPIYDIMFTQSQISLNPSLDNGRTHVLCCGLQVKVYNLMQYEHGADDVLVMGTDGLWDVLSNQEVAEAVTTFLANCDPDDLHRWDTFIHFLCSSFSFLNYKLAA